MKKQQNLLIIALMAILFLAVSCGPKEKKTDPSIINANTIISGSSDIVTVKALMYVYEAEEEEVITTTAYEKGGFKLELPKTLPNKFLYEIFEEFEDVEWITISDPKAKLAGTLLNAYSKKDKEMGEFYCFGTNKRIWVDAFHLYADRDFSIKGKYIERYWSDEYNLSLKKGWNIVYSVDEEYGWTLTTQKPADLIMEWAFEENYYWRYADVRFKKENPSEICWGIGLAPSYYPHYYHFFGYEAEISEYCQIPARNYNIMSLTEGDWIKIMDYNFEENGVYTIVCSDKDGELDFHVIKDGKSNNSKSKNLLKNRKPLIAKRMTNK
jgi:hypothetical protein